MQPLMKFDFAEKNVFVPLYNSEKINDNWEIKEIESVQQVQIIKLYKQRIESAISAIISQSSYNTEVTDISVYIHEDINKKNFGEIHSIEIMLVGYLKDTERIKLIKEIAESLEIADDKISIKITE